MTQVQIDQALQQKLGGLNQSIELCSPDGRILGRFIPENEYREMLYSTVEIPFSEEEIARRRAETGGCSLKDIWKRVGHA